MHELILHHFEASPFAEKIRLALGLKGLEWQAVEIPMIMPKPRLTALTGGYRKTPVLQVGADIYCDTQCIAIELQRRYPEPTLFPSGSEALCLALSQWSDGAFFRPGAALSMGTNELIPQEVLKDREAFFGFLDFAELDEQLPHFFSQYDVQLRLVEKMLADGRSFVLGEQPAWADILAYFPLWMGRGNIEATAEMLEPLIALRAWEARMGAIGHGSCSALEDTVALEIARASDPASETIVDAGVWPRGLAVGDPVAVTPTDYGAVPVTGALHRLTHQDVAVRRHHADTGDVVVHFPRMGYQVETES